MFSVPPPVGASSPVGSSPLRIMYPETVWPPPNRVTVLPVGTAGIGPSAGFLLGLDTSASRVTAAFVPAIAAFQASPRPA